MKVCVYGAGSIGGILAAGLAQTDHHVTVIARSETLNAIRANGLIIQSDGKERVIQNLSVTDTPDEADEQDIIFVATKSHQLIGVADNINALCGPETTVVTAQNGIPWWYNYKMSGRSGAGHLESIDPGGKLWATIGPERAVGCVVYPTGRRTAPGVIVHDSGDKFTLGEPDGSMSDRVSTISQILINAGFQAPVRDNIRDDIWKKLWGNLCFNPISALTLGTMDELTTDPGIMTVSRNMMLEAQAIGEKTGIHFRMDVDTRLEGAKKIGAHKTSMLQDIEAGRALEIDALLTVVQEIGRTNNVNTPTIDTVLALIQQRGRSQGLY